MGSTLTFVTSNPTDASKYRKWVINQGNWGERKQFLDFGYSDAEARANPHSIINERETVLTLDGVTRRVGIGIQNPSETLEIQGTIKASKARFTGDLQVGEGGVAPEGTSDAARLADEGIEGVSSTLKVNGGVVVDGTMEISRRIHVNEVILGNTVMIRWVAGDAKQTTTNTITNHYYTQTVTAVPKMSGYFEVSLEINTNSVTQWAEAFKPDLVEGPWTTTLTQRVEVMEFYNRLIGI